MLLAPTCPRTSAPTPTCPRTSAPPPINYDLDTLADQIVVGGVIEGATLGCTVQLLNRLGQLNIPATVDLPPAGTHSWMYWQDQLHRSWSFYERALR